MYGKKLKEIRKHFDLTQDKMAEMLNIKPRSYTSYERDENDPPYSMLKDLCINRNVNLNWFISDKGQMFNPPPFEQVEDKLTQIVDERLKKYGLI